MTLICFASPKGGVGKTTLAANVANELALTRLRVIALDLDPQNTLRLHFGVALDDGGGFTHRLAEHPQWRRCLRETPVGVSLLPYGSSGTDDAIVLAAAVAQMPRILLEPIDDILSSPDICLVVDTPPGPSPLLSALLPRIDLLVTVLLVDAASVALIPTIEHGAYSSGQANDSPTVAFVLNQFDPRTRLGGVIADGATRRLGERLLGIVYRDEFVAEASAAQKVLANYAPASKANHDIAAISRAILTRIGIPLPIGDVHHKKTPP
jgi:cellulose synthase operon protein YhjQ